MSTVYTVIGAVVCAALAVSSLFLLLRILAWLFVNGIPSLVADRSRAVVEWQDCDVQERTGDRHAWDSHCADAVLLTHEADPDLSEDNEAYAVDFLAWEAEFGERAQ